MNNLPFPVISLSNFANELKALGVHKKRVLSITKVDDCDKNVFPQRQQEQFRFAPTPEIIRLENNDNLWFRSQGADWATVFVLLPGDYVLLTAEYMAGADIINISHCGGISEKGEPMDQCAIREVREESGVVLESVHPLSMDGLPTSPRRSTERVYPFIGHPKVNTDGSIVLMETNHDDTEDTHPFLMSLHDYWEFINDDKYDNVVSGRDCAYAALRHLKKITLS